MGEKRGRSLGSSFVVLCPPQGFNPPLLSFVLSTPTHTPHATHPHHTTRQLVQAHGLIKAPQLNGKMFMVSKRDEGNVPTMTLDRVPVKL